MVTAAVSQVNASVFTTYAIAERGLDVLGYIPLVNFVGANLRNSLACIQLIHGAALLAIAYSAKALSSSKDKKNNCFEELKKQGLEVLKNAGLNFGRSFVESFLILGSAICLTYDFKKYKRSEEELKANFGSTVLSAEVHRPILPKITEMNKTVDQSVENIRNGITMMFVCLASAFAFAAYMSGSESSQLKKMTKDALPNRVLRMGSRVGNEEVPEIKVAAKTMQNHVKSFFDRLKVA